MRQLSYIVLGALVAMCGISHLKGEVIETNEIRTVLQHVDNDSYVFFNITGTLYAPSTTLSDNQWRAYFVTRVKQKISDPDVSQQLIDKIKNRIVQEIPKKNVEDITPQMISDLQERKIVVLGITKKQMSTSYADNFGLITRNHLLSLEINFEKTLSYLKIDKTKDQTGYSFAYGILFTNKQPEGPAMISFLKQNDLHPSSIIMVDNSLASLESVQEALQSTGIGFKGIRYGRADSLIENFDPTLGTIEFFAFINEGKIMSDAEALVVKQKDSTTNYEAKLDDYIQQAAKSLQKN